ncbi:MAG: hypothetical protein JSS90_02485 [Bacteroidetes bacterium]|jgi:tetratricopeptide (TPR) repeat protein|nr:hypothetical protein [Bacteroidota bacterium]
MQKKVISYLYNIFTLKHFTRIKIVLVITPLLFLISCSTKKNTVVNRAYHNLTAHYNGYFNARERVKEGAKTLAASHTDHYDRILDIFKYGTDDKAKAIYPDMDAAIKKSSIVIQRHSMLIDGKERCRWIPDNYLLIGKAQFYKHDFWTALETFQYVASTYKDNPKHYEGLIWLMQTQMQLGKMSDAEYLLDYLKSEKKLPSYYKALFNAVAADFYLKKDNYPKAIEQLKTAVAFTKVRADKIRYTYILAQLYQKTDSNEKAFALYHQVIKMNPDYEMTFNARINRARSFDVNSSDAAKVKNELLKMLKDEKNKEYLDQVYYALSGVAMREKDTTQAFKYLKESVAASTSNTNQKGISYLEMGEISYRKTDFRQAQLYYDSAATNIASDYPDYALIQNKKNNLSRLVKNLNIISRGDSLLALSALPESEQHNRVDGIVNAEDQEAQRLKEEEAAKKAKEQEEQSNQQFSQFQNQPNREGVTGSTTGSSWYFYNPSAISFGFSEFTKKWGNRKLEDNWRRSSKESMAAFGSAEEEEAKARADSLEAAEKAMADSIRQLNSEARKKVYFDNIPKTTAQKDETNAQILEAYYNAGIIYKEALLQPKPAADDLEEMMKRYPDNKYILPAYYNLYRCYLAIPDSNKADYYKNIILTKYEDSEYARIISNPNYFKDAQRKTAIMQVFYENTYRAFLNRQYTDVIERKSAADSLFPGGSLSPKFAYLKALAIGYTKPRPEFETALKAVVTSYPRDSVSILAKAILAKMSNPTASDSLWNAENATLPSSNKPITPSIYSFMPDVSHNVVIIFSAEHPYTNQLKGRLNLFNQRNYGANKLNISNLTIDGNVYVMVRSFPNHTQSSEYIKGLNSDPSIFEGMDKNVFTLFPITEQNFNKFVTDKDISKYLDFYRVNYPQ